jgi:hypothetical protein
VGRMKWPLAFGFVAACLVWGCVEQRDQPATNDDLRILQKAEELLKDESVWNRMDDRECDDDEATGKRSLFCALRKACIDVLGRTTIGEWRCRKSGSLSKMLRLVRISNIGSEISITCRPLG